MAFGFQVGAGETGDLKPRSTPGVPATVDCFLLSAFARQPKPPCPHGFLLRLNVTPILGRAPFSAEIFSVQVPILNGVETSCLQLTTRYHDIIRCRGFAPRVTNICHTFDT